MSYDDDDDDDVVHGSTQSLEDNETQNREHTTCLSHKAPITLLTGLSKNEYQHAR